MNSKDYWEKRAIERLTRAEVRSEPYLKKIYGIYTSAQKQTVQDIQHLYRIYYAENKWDTAALNAIAPSGDLVKFYNQLRAAGLEKRLPERFNGRLSRLELLNAQLWMESKKVAQKQNEVETQAHSATIKDSYYRAIYDSAKKLGATEAFSTLDDKTINKILRTKFAGANYSERIWKNTDKLADSLQEVIGKAVALGQSPEVTARMVRERFGVSQYAAMRLVRTETSYFENLATVESYKEMGIEKFQFIATLDMRTSDICRSMDKRIFSMKSAKVGENVPPLHPWCRSTITPYLGKEYKVNERIARDPSNDKNYYVQGDMTYANWHKSLVDRFANKLNHSVTITGVSRDGMVATDFGATFDAFSMLDVDDALVDEIAKNAETLMNAHPELQAWAKSQSKDGLVIRGSKPSSMRYETIASTRRQPPIISLNKRYYKSAKKLSSDVFKGVRSGHFMPATNYKGYTFYHEFGHFVENYLLRRNNTDTAARRIMNDIIDIAVRQTKTDRKTVMAQASKYATSKEHGREFFAEAFANLYSGRPNAIGKAMKTYLEQELK